MAPCDLVPVSFKKSFARKLDVEITKRHMMKKENDMASSFQSKHMSSYPREVFSSIDKEAKFSTG